MPQQIAIPAVLMRGGTSKGPFFLRSDLPDNQGAMSRVLLAALGSPDARQVDGIGGATPLTSKVCIVSKSEHANADVDYLFAQVTVDRAFVDFGPTCGNMLSGIGPFAIEQRLVPAQDGETQVCIHAVNTGALIEAVVRTPGARVEYDGDCAIDGVPGTAAPILLKFLDIVGGKTGSLFPAGAPVVEVEGIEVTGIDVAMPMVLARAADMGIDGSETAAELTANTGLMARMEIIRRAASQRMGLGDATGKVIPKFGILSAPRSGGTITSRYFTPVTCHEAHAVTGTICVSSASLLPGTIAADIAGVTRTGTDEIVIEHPAGTLGAVIETVNMTAGVQVVSGGITRTARRLFEGNVLVPAAVWNGCT